MIASALTCVHGSAPCGHLPYTGLNLLYALPLIISIGSTLIAVGVVLYRAGLRADEEQ